MSSFYGLSSPQTFTIETNTDRWNGAPVPALSVAGYWRHTEWGAWSSGYRCLSLY